MEKGSDGVVRGTRCKQNAAIFRPRLAG
jgi:hypothetical protein